MECWHDRHCPAFRTVWPGAHGGAGARAFADASSWNGVIERLQHQGCTVVAPANPLRGVALDAAYLASVVNQFDGPVLLVGHSYGGAVITNAAATATGVVGLAFVAAFAPDEGEVLGDVAASSKDSLLGTAQVQREYRTGPGDATSSPTRRRR